MSVDYGITKKVQAVTSVPDYTEKMTQNKIENIQFFFFFFFFVAPEK